MPGYQVGHGEFVKKISELEKAGETVIAITADPSGVYVVTEKKAARRKAGEQETR